MVVMKRESFKDLPNHHIVTLAVYLLGGDARKIDTEDIAKKANELAPGRFTWRKYSDQINIDTVRKRLWDAMRTDKGGLLKGTERGGWILTDGSPDNDDEGGKASEPSTQNPGVEPALPDAPKMGRPAGSQGSKSRPAGGFRVEFKPCGSDSHRAQYVPDERTIYINLDHPQLDAAKGVRPVDDPIFRRLAYEVAFSEYAIALAQELARRDEYLDPTDPIFDIRETINRVARKGASLYAE